MKSFLVRMRSHRILHGLVSAQLSTVGGAFIVNVLSARALGPEGRGEVAFFLQLSYLVGALAPLGRDRSVLSVIHGEHGHGADQRTRVPGELLATPVLIATAASLILGIVLAVSTQSAVIAVGFWMLLLGNLGSRFFRSDAIVGHRSSPFVIATLAGQGVLVIAALYLLIEGIGSVGHWIIAYGVAMLLPFLAISFPSQTRLPCAVRGTADKSGEVRRLGVALLPSSLAEMALTKLDRIVLPVLGTFSQLGYYSVAVTLVEFSSMPFRQHVDSRIPVWATRWSEARLYPFRAMFRPLLTAIIITACVSAATAIMIVPIFGESYAPAVGLVPWLAMATWSHIASLYIYGLVTAIGSARTATSMFVLGALVALPCYIIAIPLFGAAGASAGLAVGYLVSVIIGGCMLKRAMQVKVAESPTSDRES